MNRDPLHITYNDLIKEQEERLQYMERDYPPRVNAGSMKSWTAARKIEMQKRLIRILKKYARNQQLDLFELFRKAG